MNVTAGRTVYKSAEHPEVSRLGVATPCGRGIISKDMKTGGGEERDLTGRRTLHLPALIVAAVVFACAAALLAVSEKAEATFPGKNGRIAFSSGRGGSMDIYTISFGGKNVKGLTSDPVGGTLLLAWRG